MFESGCRVGAGLGAQGVCEDHKYQALFDGHVEKLLLEVHAGDAHVTPKAQQYV